VEGCCPTVKIETGRSNKRQGKYRGGFHSETLPIFKDRPQHEMSSKGVFPQHSRKGVPEYIGLFHASAKLVMQYANTQGYTCKRSVQRQELESSCVVEKLLQQKNLTTTRALINCYHLA